MNTLNILPFCQLCHNKAKKKKTKIEEEEGSEGYNAIKNEQELAQAWI